MVNFRIRESKRSLKLSLLAGEYEQVDTRSDRIQNV
jgi:hypothetical protein